MNSKLYLVLVLILFIDFDRISASPRDDSMNQNSGYEYIWLKTGKIPNIVWNIQFKAFIIKNLNSYEINRNSILNNYIFKTINIQYIFRPVTRSPCDNSRCKQACNLAGFMRGFCYVNGNCECLPRGMCQEETCAYGCKHLNFGSSSCKDPQTCMCHP